MLDIQKDKENTNMVSKLIDLDSQKNTSKYLREQL